MQYLIPCKCGENVAVERAQAGLSVRCKCGEQLAVPTVRGLGTLEKIDDQDRTDTSAAPAWGLRQSILSLGGFILLGALIALGILAWMRPQNPARPLAEYQVNQMDPLDRMIYWNEVRDHPRGFNTDRTHVLMREYAQRSERNTRWMWIVGVIGIVGAGILVSGLFVRGGK